MGNCRTQVKRFSSTWIFAEGSDEHQETIGDFAAEGLGKLAGELKYGKEQDEDINLPRLR